VRLENWKAPVEEEVVFWLSGGRALRMARTMAPEMGLLVAAPVTVPWIVWAWAG